MLSIAAFAFSAVEQPRNTVFNSIYDTHAARISPEGFTKVGCVVIAVPVVVIVVVVAVVVLFFEVSDEEGRPAVSVVVF